MGKGEHQCYFRRIAVLFQASPVKHRYIDNYLYYISVPRTFVHYFEESVKIKAIVNVFLFTCA